MASASKVGAAKRELERAVKGIKVPAWMQKVQSDEMNVIMK
jgi:hypothetical protein